MSVQQHSQQRLHITIVGAGIVGVCTAYYLTRHPSFDPSLHKITIIESTRVAGGASGKAGGLLALWAFPRQLVPESFRLHQELARQYNGQDEWGYRRVQTVSIEGNLVKKRSKASTTTSSNIPPAAGGEEQQQDRFKGGLKAGLGTSTPTSDSDTSSSASSLAHGPKLPTDLDWIKPEIIDDWSFLGGKDTTAQVHPYKFTISILKKALESGAVELVIGKVVDIHYNQDTGAATGLSYLPNTFTSASAATKTSEDQQVVDGTSSTSSTSKDTSGRFASKPITLDSDRIIVTAGPWTNKLLPQCPISGLRAHSITISTQKPVSAYAVFTELKLGNGHYTSPEIYARKDEVYVCGEGDPFVKVPETTDDVKVVKAKGDDLFKYAGAISKELSQGRLGRRQACYLPVLDVPSSSGPLIGHTTAPNLYLGSGHSCWGINNAPITGKCLAELVLDGHATSADLTGLEPSRYFYAGPEDED